MTRTNGGLLEISEECHLVRTVAASHPNMFDEHRDAREAFRKVACTIGKLADKVNHRNRAFLDRQLRSSKQSSFVIFLCPSPTDSLPCRVKPTINSSVPGPLRLIHHQTSAPSCRSSPGEIMTLHRARASRSYSKEK